MRLIVPCLALLCPLVAARAGSPDPEPAGQPAPVAAEPAPAPAQPATEPAPEQQAAEPAPAEPAAEPAPAQQAAEPASAEQAAEPAPEPEGLPEIGKISPQADSASPKAAPTPYPWRKPAPAKFGGSYTWAPLHLQMPMIEFTGEMTLTSKHSLAIVLGAGWPTATTTPSNPFESPQTVHLRAINAGAQYRYYLLGNFDHGLNLGTEILLSDFTGQAYVDSAVTWSLLFGAKYAFPFGLTFDGQVGPGLRFVGASRAQATPVYNVNVGWSFVFHRKKKHAEATKQSSDGQSSAQDTGGEDTGDHDQDDDGGFDLDD